MTTTIKLTTLEAKLFLREPISIAFGLVFPALLLLALGYLFPGFDEPVSELGWLRYIDVYSPMAIALGIATLAFVTLPPLLGSYRQFGILRRLRTTPLFPARLLMAELTVHASMALLASSAAVIVAVVAFDVPFPKSPLLFLLVFALGVASVFSIGLLIGALVRTTTAGMSIGMAVYFPMLFLAGLWIPRMLMPDGLRLVSDLTPLGSAVQGLEDSWLHGTVDPLHLIVMAVWAVVMGLLAVRAFRWD